MKKNQRKMELVLILKEYQVFVKNLFFNRKAAIFNKIFNNFLKRVDVKRKVFRRFPPVSLAVVIIK